MKYHAKHGEFKAWSSDHKDYKWYKSFGQNNALCWQSMNAEKLLYSAVNDIVTTQIDKVNCKKCLKEIQKITQG